MDPAPTPPPTGIRQQSGASRDLSPERSLGFGRLWAAVGILILACLDSRSSQLLRGHVVIFLSAFVLYSLLVLLLLRRRRKWPERARFALHCMDVVSVVLVATVVRTSEAAIFLLVLFVLVAAAQRWGPSHVVWTAGAYTVLLSAGLFLAVSLKPGVDLQEAVRPGTAALSLAGFAVFATGLLWQITKTDVALRWESSARAAQNTRAQVSRDLHDGPIQSLFTVEYRLEKLKTDPAMSPEANDELVNLQRIIHTSVVELRQIVEQGRPVNLGQKSFVEYISDLAAEFEIETGIAVRFVFDGGQISPPPAVAGELVRIVQEALLNVKKHSGARNVSIGFTVDRGQWILRIDDDGRGFDFAGRLGMPELEEKSQGPFVIRERVSTLGGELEIESKPGQGSRLEIAFPKDALG